MPTFREIGFFSLLGSVALSQAERTMSDDFSATSVGATGSLQYWTAPVTGVYRITAYGAEGGGETAEMTGNGAKMAGDFTIVEGQELEILVGQYGLDHSDSYHTNYPGGGGGGSFACKKNPSGKEDIYIAAGGGGGEGNSYDTSYRAGKHASTGTAGLDGHNYEGDGGYGGDSGNGGTVGDQPSGGAGGGFLTDGESASDGEWGSEGDGGNAYLNNGTGGEEPYKANGGYGGGGAGGGDFGSGAGGGYSGGGPGYYDRGSGGGGSYNLGSNQDNEAGVQIGNGLVVIELISIPKVVDIGRLTQLCNISFDSTDRYIWFFATQPPSSKPFHQCILTGDKNGLDDIELPISHFSCRITEDGASSITVKIPNMVRHTAGVTARMDGQLIIRKGTIHSDGIKRLREFVRAGNFRIMYEVGQQDSFLVLRASDNISFSLALPTEEVELNEISRSRKRDGSYDLQIEPIPGILPGSHVWVGGYRYLVKENSATIGPTVSRMGLRAVRDPEG